MKSFLNFFLPILPVVSGLVIPRADEPCAYHHGDPDLMVENDYRVLFNDGHTLDEHFQRIGYNLSETAEKFRYIGIINGYRARLDPDTVHDLVRYDPGVQLVEHNNYLPRDGLLEPSEPVKIPRTTSGLEKRWSEAVDEEHPWWLKMTNIGKKMRLDEPTYPDKFYAEAGQGVKIYVLDTGVLLNHKVFTERGGAVNFLDGEDSPYTGTTWADEDGHGSHVAGIAAQRAPKAQIVNVKVLTGAPDNKEPPSGGRGRIVRKRSDSGDGGSGDDNNNDVTVSDIVDALDQVVERHADDKKAGNGFKGSVINMSFNLVNDDSLKTAIAGAIKAGIPVVTSAGNEGLKTGTIPCGYADVVCVAACTQEYTKQEHSSWGNNVNYAAPGALIPSASNEGPNEWAYRSGTSMASPVAAGILASYIGYEGLTSDTKKALLRLSDNSIVPPLRFPAEGPTKLVNTGYGNPKRATTDPYWISDAAREAAAGFVEMDFAKAANTSGGPTTTFTTTWDIPTAGPHISTIYGNAVPFISNTSVPHTTLSS